MVRLVVVVLLVVVPACRTTHELKGERAASREAPIELRLVDSRLRHGHVSIELQLGNRTDVVCWADRRLIILTAGGSEYGPESHAKWHYQLPPHVTKSITLEYRHAPADAPAFTLVFKPGAVRRETKTGAVIEVAPLTVVRHGS